MTLPHLLHQSTIVVERHNHATPPSLPPCRPAIVVSCCPPLHARRLLGTAPVLSPMAVLLLVTSLAAGCHITIGTLRAGTSIGMRTLRRADGPASHLAVG
jgi:hypothetical protein